MKQKAREAKNAAASAKKDYSEEIDDKIMKPKAREAKNAAASAKKDYSDEIDDKITKQKAREVGSASASAKREIDEEINKIEKPKVREVGSASVSAKREIDEKIDKIAKPKDRKMIVEDERELNFGPGSVAPLYGRAGKPVWTVSFAFDAPKTNTCLGCIKASGAFPRRQFASRL